VEEFGRNPSKILIKRMGLICFWLGQQPRSFHKLQQSFDTIGTRLTIKGFRYKIFSGIPAEFLELRSVTEGLLAMVNGFHIPWI